LDVSASFDPASGTAAVFLVNRAAGAEADVDIRFGDARVSGLLGAWELSHPDPKAANSWEAPENVKPRPAKAFLEDGRARVSLPRPGFAALQLRIGRRNI